MVFGRLILQPPISNAFIISQSTTLFKPSPKYEAVQRSLIFVTSYGKTDIALYRKTCNDKSCQYNIIFT